MAPLAQAAALLNLGVAEGAAGTVVTVQSHIPLRDLQLLAALTLVLHGVGLQGVHGGAVPAVAQAVGEAHWPLGAAVLLTDDLLSLVYRAFLLGVGTIIAATIFSQLSLAQWTVDLGALHLHCHNRECILEILTLMSHTVVPRFWPGLTRKVIGDRAVAVFKGAGLRHTPPTTLSWLGLVLGALRTLGVAELILTVDHKDI